MTLPTDIQSILKNLSKKADQAGADMLEGRVSSCKAWRKAFEKAEVDLAALLHRYQLQGRIDQLKGYRNQRCGCLVCDAIEDDLAELNKELGKVSE